jgi:hypothetical protein
MKWSHSGSQVIFGRCVAGVRLIVARITTTTIIITTVLLV